MDLSMPDPGSSGNEAIEAGCEDYPLAPAGHADHRLSTIFEIARILATEHDLPAMLHKFLCCLVQTFDVADWGMLLLADTQGFLTVAASLGYLSSALGDMRLAPGESMTGLAFQSGQPALY